MSNPNPKHAQIRQDTTMSTESLDNARDRSNVHIWFFEDACPEGDVLTRDGISQIVHHKYVSGEYTHFDNFCNPMWTYCTETFLPLTMAPNMVTTLGGFFCALSYIATWYYLPQFEATADRPIVPYQLLVFNGVCILLYFTLDCMDGKQARRTGSSSPLGQLFDHGVDCFANISMLSIVQSWARMGPSRDYMISHFGLQIVFFAPQWEEYHTGVLTHAYGKWIGVTEVNYGLAAMTIAFAFMDTEAFFGQTVQEMISPMLPISILPQDSTNPSQFTFVSIINTILQANNKKFFLALWILLVTGLTASCLRRTVHHPNVTSSRMAVSAISKWISPVLVTIMMVGVVPTEVIEQECRLLSVAAGLCLCFITIKLIVLSMARMAYASIQPDILPLLIVLAFVSWEYEYAALLYDSDQEAQQQQRRRLQPLGLTLLLQLLIAFYVARILYWTSTAMGQVCRKLDIYVFTIKHPKVQ